MADYRDITVVCQRYDQWGAHVACAARLSQHYRAHLTGLYLRWPVIDPGIAALPELAEEMLRRADADLNAARAAEADFSHFAAMHGAESVDWLVVQGDPACAVPFVGACQDLFVLEAPASGDGAYLGFVEQVILASDQPCLLVAADDTNESGRFERIAIGWNGSIEARRAIHSALPLLENAERVVLLCGEQRRYGGLRPCQPPNDMETYLRDHGVQVAYRPLEPENGRSDGETLLNAADEMGADLLIMGAYGHARLREWVLGGATRYALRHCRTALFMRH